MSISRRDFLNGVALTVASGLTPLQQIASASDEHQLNFRLNKDYYPPKLQGIRGNHDGSFEVAHQLARAHKKYEIPKHIDEEFDLIIVGAGISGLAAAYLFRERFGLDKKILIIDNHDDFGGHAKRNEFKINDDLRLGYGGSESLQSPRLIYSKNATDFINKIGINVDKLEAAFDVDFYPNLGLSRGVFFDKAHFGETKIVTGDPSQGVADEIPKDKKNGRPYKAFINDFPLSEDDREKIIHLYDEDVDFLKEMTVSEKEDYLSTHSYSDFLREKVKLSEQGILYFQQQTHDFFALGIDALSGFDGRSAALPGFNSMGITPMDEEEKAEIDDLYVYHFPDGNASIARLIVQRLIPEIANSNNMDDVVMAKFDYSQLDKPSANVKIRLNSTALFAENTFDAQATEVTYVRDGVLHKVKGNHTIMAGYNMMIPAIVPSLPEAQKQAMRLNVKAPLVYTRVVLDNWKSFMALGVHKIYSPAAPYSTVKLDFPVSMGGYKHPKNENEPMILHMIYVPAMANSGLSSREQSRMGRAQLLSMTFEDHEKMIRDQLEEMLSPAGFTQDDILAITVNRWSHGYAYAESSLSDDENSFTETMRISRQPLNRIYIANSDSQWDAYAHAAIDAAYRAVEEIENNS